MAGGGSSRAGFDPAVIAGIGPWLQAAIANDIHSVPVVRHGKLVYEQYFFDSEDQRLGRPLGTFGFDAETNMFAVDNQEHKCAGPENRNRQWAHREYRSTGAVTTAGIR